jgi:hypothetical protein
MMAHTTTDSTPSRYSTKSTMSGTKSTNHPLKTNYLCQSFAAKN